MASLPLKFVVYRRLNLEEEDVLNLSDRLIHLSSSILTSTPLPPASSSHGKPPPRLHTALGNSQTRQNKRWLPIDGARGWRLPKPPHASQSTSPGAAPSSRPQEGSSGEQHPTSTSLPCSPAPLPWKGKISFGDNFLRNSKGRFQGRFHSSSSLQQGKGLQFVFDEITGREFSWQSRESRAACK